MECSSQYFKRVVEYPKLARRAEQVSASSGVTLLRLEIVANGIYSSSPLNGEAAHLWDRDQAEYKRKVLARHQEPAELDD